MAASTAAIAQPVAAQMPASQKSVPSDIQTVFERRGIDPQAPIYIRVFKEESELEVWKALPNGRYVAIKTYPICAWSGALGPKKVQGDRMSPEGFYGFGPGGLNPASKYHLALNVGYPNRLDRALGRTGNFIMVHGQCVSIGCFAMTNDLIEEIYALARDALDGGEGRIPVHIFPFRMTAANMARHRSNPAYASWAPLRDAYDDFAQTYEPPKVSYCGGKYIVNPVAEIEGAPKDACPTRIGKLLAPLSPKLQRKLAFINTPLFAEGPKTRSVTNAPSAWSLIDVPASAAKTARTHSDQGRIKAANTYDNGSLTPYVNRR